MFRFLSSRLSLMVIFITCQYYLNAINLDPWGLLVICEERITHLSEKLQLLYVQYKKRNESGIGLASSADAKPKQESIQTGGEPHLELTIFNSIEEEEEERDHFQ